MKTRGIKRNLRLAFTKLWIKKSVHKSKKIYSRKVKHRINGNKD